MSGSVGRCWVCLSEFPQPAGDPSTQADALCTCTSISAGEAPAGRTGKVAVAWLDEQLICSTPLSRQPMLARQWHAHWPMTLPCRQTRCTSASSSAGGSSPFRSPQSLDNGNGKPPEVSNWVHTGHTVPRGEAERLYLVSWNLLLGIPLRPVPRRRRTPDASQQTSVAPQQSCLAVRGKGGGPNSCPRHLDMPLLAAVCTAATC